MFGITLQSEFYLKYPLMMTDRIAYVGRATGLYLYDKYKDDPSYNTYTVATNAAGAIPYFSGMNCLDMLGLNDPFIGKRDVSALDRKEMLGHESGGGHDKGWGWYVVNQMPEIVILYNVAGLPMSNEGQFRQKPHYLSDLEFIAEAKRYSMLYDPVVEPIYVDDDRVEGNHRKPKNVISAYLPRTILPVWGLPHRQSWLGQKQFSFGDLGAKMYGEDEFFRYDKQYKKSSMNLDGSVLTLDDAVWLFHFTLKPEALAAKRAYKPIVEPEATP